MNRILEGAGIRRHVRVMDMTDEMRRKYRSHASLEDDFRGQIKGGSVRQLKQGKNPGVRDLRQVPGRAAGPGAKHDATRNRRCKTGCDRGLHAGHLRPGGMIQSCRDPGLKDHEATLQFFAKSRVGSGRIRENAGNQAAGRLGVVGGKPDDLVVTCHGIFFHARLESGPT